MSHPPLGALMRAHEVLRHGGHPLALLDLDLTLLDNGPRTRAILTSWVERLDGRLPGATVAAMAERAATMPLVFSIRDNLWRVLVGSDPEGSGEDTTLRTLAHKEELAPLAKEGFHFWRDAFFDPAWLDHDVALPGAADAVRALVDEAVTVVYVTARKVDLAAATVSSLLRLGFPIAGPHALLLTNDHPSRTDHESKIVSLDYCARLGTPVLCAENEPAHANTMHRRFPSALTVLVETRHSEPAPPLDSGVARVAGIADAL
jgi:hypothetical protein